MKALIEQERDFLDYTPENGQPSKAQQRLLNFE
jgi:hypothetical protein